MKRKSEKEQLSALYNEFEAKGILSEWEKFGIFVWPIHDKNLMDNKVSRLWESYCKENSIEGNHPDYKQIKEVFYKDILNGLEQKNIKQDEAVEHVAMVTYFKSELYAIRRRKNDVSFPDVFKIGTTELGKYRPYLKDYLKHHSKPQMIAKLCIAMEKMEIVDLSNKSDLTCVLNDLTEKEIKRKSLSDAIIKAKDLINPDLKGIYSESFKNDIDKIISELQELYKKS
jgi:hypothetical protein